MSTITTTQLQQQYIAYFGRPGDPAGIKYWLASGLTETQFAAQIHGQDEYQKSTVGDKSTEAQVDNLYKNLFGRSADASGLLYWTGEVEAGRSSIADLAVKLIHSAKNPSTGDETQGAADAAALTAKTATAIAFTADVEADAAAILAYNPESEGTTFIAGAAFDSAVTFLSGITSTEATAAAIDTAVSNVKTASTPATTGETKSLTTGVDAFTGTANNDTFVASQATLTAGDAITGGEGADTLTYSSTGTAAVSESGFTTSGVETLKLTSTTTGGTTINATGASDVTKIVNSTSTTDVTVNGVKALSTVEVDSVSAGNTTVVFDDALLTGSADALTLNVKSNVTTANAAIGTITVGNNSSGGIETLNVNSSSAASKITALVSGAATVNVTGDKNLTVSNALAGATAVDATNFTGNLSVVLDSAGTAKDVVVTGGSGDDTADFTNGFNAGDSFTGGEGTDSIKLTQAAASGTIAGTLSGVEQLSISDAGTGTIDMDSFAGVTKVIYDAGITANGTATVDDAVSGVSVEVDAAQLVANDGSLLVDLKTDGTDDAITVAIDAVGAGEGVASISAADAETLTISVDDDTTDATGTYVIASLTASDATKLVLSGDSTITITDTVDPSTPVLATLDASAATDKLTISATNFASGGATVTLGSANDVFNVATMSGADTFDLSKGGDDKIVYTLVAQSDSDMDTIKGFTSGSDDIDLTGFATAITTSGQFAGSKADFGAAQGALTSTKQAVFQIDTNTLWVDNGDEQLDGTDFRVKLEGLTSLLATDLALDTGITATSNQAAFSTATKTHFTEGKALTNEADTLNTTVAHLAGSTIDGKAGDDTINITGSGAIDTSALAFSDIETMTLGASVTGVTIAPADIAAAELTTITGVTGTTQTLTVTDTVDLSIAELRKIETVSSTSGDAVSFTMDEDNFTNVTSVLFPGAAADTLALAAGTYDFSSSTVTFGAAASVITFAGAASLTADPADIANVATFTGNGTDGVTTTLTITGTDTLAATAVTEIDTFVLQGADTTLTLDHDDLTTAAAADTLGMTFTGSGTSNFVAAVGGGAGAFSLADFSFTGFDSINVDAAVVNVDFTIDASSIVGTAVTVTGDSGSDFLITETGDYTGIITAATSHDTLVLTDGITATVDEQTLDTTGTVDTMIAFDSTGTVDANLAINMVGTTLDLSAVVVGATQDVDTVITGTSGNDIIAAYDTSTTGSATTIDGNGGTDIFRLENNSGNSFAADSGLFTAALADAVVINNFDAANDTISFAVADVTGTSAGTAVKDAWNATTGDGFALLSGTTLTDYTTEASVYSAIGDVTMASGAMNAVALANASGTQVGIYMIDAIAAITDAAVDGLDSVSLVAVVNVSSGTFGVSNLAVH